MKGRSFIQVNNRLQACFLLLIALMLAGCTIAMYRDRQSNQVELTSSIDNTVFTPPQQLRVMNCGSEDIYNLVILFPGDTADAEAISIGFGDIPAGEITEYRSVPNGVYRYAAYEYMSDGHVIEQPVMDWVGENSLQGEKFTYQVELNSNNEPGIQIQLVKVVVDQP